METFGDWLQGELNKRGMKQADLAREAGLTTATVSRLVTQQRSPDDETCVKIARAFGNVSAEEVFRRAGKLPPAPSQEHEHSLRELYELAKRLTSRQREELLEFAYFQYRRRREREQVESKPDSHDAPPD